jgi:predicted kinase
MKNKTVYIMQGVSGSGKSTYAASLNPRHVVSADDYFVNEAGEYGFDAALLPEAHAECLRRFVSLVTIGAEGPIVVDNTNTTNAEIAPYYALAESYGYEPTIVSVFCDPKVAHLRNQHGVPLETCLKAAERIRRERERMPPWWKLDEVTPG